MASKFRNLRLASHFGAYDQYYMVMAGQFGVQRLTSKFTAFLAALVILPGALLAVPEAAFAVDAVIPCSESGTFEILNDVVVEHVDCVGIPLIPEYVTAIDNYAFANSAITSITIPAGVASIGEGAFANTYSLSSVNFAPQSILTNIVPWTFQDSAVQTIVLPKSLTTIQDYAFYYLPNLVSVTFPLDGNLTSIGDQSFTYNFSLPSLHFPATLQSIGSYAFFYNQSLSSLTFEGPAPTVGENAFQSIGSNPSAYRKSSLFGFGPDGSNWNGLTVVGLPSEVQINCYVPMQDKTFVLDSSGMNFHLFGCLNPTDGERAPDNTSYLVSQAGSIQFTPETGNAAIYTFLPTPEFVGGAFALSSDVVGRPTSRIADSLTGIDASIGYFSLAPGSLLPDGVTLSSNGDTEVTDSNSLAAGAFGFAASWSFDEGLANDYDHAENAATAEPLAFTAVAEFNLTLLAEEEFTDYQIFQTRLAQALISQAAGDWSLALDTYKLLNPSFRIGLASNEWLEAELAVENFEAGNLGPDEAKSVVNAYAASSIVRITYLSDFRLRITDAEYPVVTTTAGTLTSITYSNPFAFSLFTVPANVYQLSVNLLGAEGAQGGNDSAGRPPAAGYKGAVSGSIAVTPGQILRIGVGGRGIDSISAPYCSSGLGASSGDSNISIGGTNPLGGYAGGNGGSPAPYGCSGYGGSGGAASVIEIGDAVDPTSGGVIIAGGSGGSGGSGQYAPTLGQISLSTFVPRVDLTTTNGQDGIYSWTRCIETNSSNCDGGGGAGGGGGAQGGIQGAVEFGAGSSNEWFGLGAAPGQNSTADFVGLSAGYNFYMFDEGANHNGQITISYEGGAPSAPTSVTGSPLDSAVNLYWNAPAQQGASEITSYRVQYSTDQINWVDALNCNSAATSCLIEGLANGTDYYFAVAATNSSGTSAWSTQSQSVTPSGPAAAPLITGMAPGDGKLTLEFSAPESGTPIIGYEYSLNEGAWSIGEVTGTLLTISGLTNGTIYSVRIRAVNGTGSGASSLASNQTPSALPGAPTITSLVAGGDGTSLIVNFFPGYNGGSAITGYEYAVSIGENTTNFGVYQTAGSLSSPVTISGLQTGTTYTVSLRAINAVGEGESSVYQTGVTLARPNAPIVSVPSVGDRRITVRYEPYTLATNGGSAIIRVEYSFDNGLNWQNVGSLSNPFSITGLTNGNTYSLKVRTTNSIGTSEASIAVSVKPIVAPSAPQTVIVNSALSALRVSWTAPLSNGGSAVTNYTATAYSDSGSSIAVASCTVLALTCSIAGLEIGTTYFVSVVATNAAGAGSASFPTLRGVPVSLPGAPVINSISAGSSYVTVVFTPGANDANAPIVSYKYSIDGGATWQSTAGTSSSMMIANLQNGTNYDIAIKGVSSFGDGDSSNVVAAMPFTVPDAVDPTKISYTALSGSVTVNWVAPNSNGANISEYAVTLFDSALSGQNVQTCTVADQLTCNFFGLNDGQTYYVSIQSLNAAGYSLRSSPRVAVSPGNASTVTVSSNLSSINAGNSLTLTATINADATGTISFLSGGTSITGCSAVAINAGTAVCVTSSLAAGVQNIQANYGGSNIYSSSISPAVTVTVNLRAQVITFGALQDELLAVGSIQVSATGGASSNPVTFASTTLATCTTGGTNGTTVTLLLAGPCRIRATQAGTPNYQAAVAVVQSFTVRNEFVWNYLANGGTATWSSGTFVEGDMPLELPSASRESYVFEGWFTEQSAGTKIGDAGDLLTPLTSRSLYAHWTQLSLYGMGPATKIGSFTTISSIANSFTAEGRQNSVRISYEADALPENTVVDVYLLSQNTRAEALIQDVNAFLVSLVVAWKAPNGTVPLTADGKPISITISNPNIRAGSAIYSVLGQTVTLLGTAQIDGEASITITEDPEIVIAAAISGVPTAVSAVAGSTSAAVSWFAPSNNGGSAVTSYTVTSSGGQSCTTATLSCTVSGLTSETDYTFTVRATNQIGVSASSPASASSRTLAAAAPTPEKVVPILVTLLGAPTGVTLSALSNTVTVSWSAPATTGLSPITEYVVEANGGLGCTTAQTSCTITDVAPGISYNFVVSAINAQGKGPSATAASGSLLLRKLVPLGAFKKAEPLTATEIRPIIKATVGSSRTIMVQFTVYQNSSKMKPATRALLVSRQLKLIRSQIKANNLSAVVSVTYKYIATGTGSLTPSAVLVIR